MPIKTQQVYNKWLSQDKSNSIPSDCFSKKVKSTSYKPQNTNTYVVEIFDNDGSSVTNPPPIKEVMI